MLTTAGLLLVLLGAACAAPATDDGAPTGVPFVDGQSRAPAPITVDGLEQRADAGGFALFTAGGDIGFLTGMNVGSAIPGRLPAELEVDRETWRRWLPMIADTGVHAIRVYTMQPPHFYEELRDFNLEHPAEPLLPGPWCLGSRGASGRGP